MVDLSSSLASCHACCCHGPPHIPSPPPSTGHVVEVPGGEGDGDARLGGGQLLPARRPHRRRHVHHVRPFLRRRLQLDHRVLPGRAVNGGRLLLLLHERGV